MKDNVALIAYYLDFKYEGYLANIDGVIVKRVQSEIAKKR